MKQINKNRFITFDEKEVKRIKGYLNFISSYQRGLELQLEKPIKNFSSMSKSEQEELRDRLCMLDHHVDRMSMSIDAIRKILDQYFEEV